METEDWDNLKTYLEDQIYEKGHIKTQFIRVLVNAYLVKSEVGEILRLDGHLKENHPGVRMKYSLLLSIPYILTNDAAAMKDHFKGFLGETKGKDLDWIKWGYAFASFLSEERENAKYVLLEIAPQRRDKILCLLTGYILDAFREQDEQAAAAVDSIRTELRKDFTRAAWEKEVEKAKGEIFIVIMTKIISEATEWLFKDN